MAWRSVAWRLSPALRLAPEAQALVMSRPKPVRLTADNITQLLDSVDLILSDCDGVIWNYHGAIPNAREGFARLESYGKKILFVSNNALLSEEKQHEKFRKYGYDLQPHEVCTPSIALAHRLRRAGQKRKMLVLASEGFKQMLRDAGVKVLDAGTRDVIHDIATLEKVTSPMAEQDIDAVVCDFDMNLTYAAMMQAVHALHRPGCQLIVGCDEARVAIGTSAELIGPSLISKILTDMTGREPIVIGKPQPVMIMEYLQDHHNIKADRTLYIGDHIHLDFGAAHKSGIKRRLLVLTGVAKEADVACCAPELVPEYIIDSVGDFLKLLPPAASSK